MAMSSYPTIDTAASDIQRFAMLFCCRPRSSARYIAAPAATSAAQVIVDVDIEGSRSQLALTTPGATTSMKPTAIHLAREKALVCDNVTRASTTASGGIIGIT